MDQPIRLSTLSRELNVGYLYNYHTDKFSSCIQVPKENVKIENKFNSQLYRSFLFPHQSLKSKRHMLGINTHLSRSIEQGFIDWNEFWLANYLQIAPTSCDDNIAQVDVYFKVVRRIETLDPRFRQSKWKEYQTVSEGQTHLVEQVVYGAEFLCSMSRTVDTNRETKESAQSSIYLAAKTYFDQAIGPNSIDVQTPVELENVTCTLYNNLGDVVVGPFSSSSNFLKDIINDDDPLQQWRPIEILLRYIPDQLEARLLSEKTDDAQLEKEKTEETWKWLDDQSSLILNHPSFGRIRPLAKIVTQFRYMLGPLRKAIAVFEKSMGPDKEATRLAVSNLLRELGEWLIHRHKEMQMMCSLLKDNTQLLPYMFDLEEIKSWAPSNGLKKADAFIMKVDYIKQDQLMEKIKVLIRHPDPIEMLPVFPIFSLGKKRLELISKSLQQFAEGAQVSQLGPSPDVGHYIGLVPASSLLDDGTITMVEFPDKKSLRTGIRRSLNRPQVLVGDDSSHAGNVGSQPKQTQRTTVEIEDTTRKRNANQSFATFSADPGNIQLKNQRIAEYFTRESNGCSQLIKRGKPNVFLLNAEDNSNDADFRWFDIGLPDDTNREHKVIILMGATGCGKSTLINGMINYILGVQWKDPFRFKCVREDKSITRNQAHSQTSSVTAYKIHHHEGMAVPYSITIIDTPGYGDTRGITRDKEITQLIHRFLGQEENRVQQIHAACFVAASGDSRLTTTQRYILDSVLSIIGKDAKENIRLLFTFADNAVPPLVDAFRLENFPVTSESAGTTYCKFNSSVLYASNEQQGEEDFSFDELFWDMGQENCTKFFTMLEREYPCSVFF